jgi:Putative addiction module component
MSLTEEQIYEEAMLLPNDSKVALAERLVQYVETHADSNLERLHLEIVKKRREEIRSGQIQPIDGESALKHVREFINT